MGESSRRGGPSKGSFWLALGIVVCAGVGVVASRRGVLYRVSWERGEHVLLSATVRGPDRKEAKVAGFALALAAVVAGYRVAVGGALAPVLTAANGLAALGAMGWLAWALRRDSAEVASAAALTATPDIQLALDPAAGFFVLAGAALAVLCLSAAAWRWR